METLKGCSDRILEFDLSSGTAAEFTVTEIERKLYLGGKGLGIKILADRLDLSVNPLDPENMIVFMMGAMLGTGAPCTARFAAVSKSPLTGILASSSCGGPFGMAFKSTGYTGLLLKGRADEPSILEISHDSAVLKPAGKLWGMDSFEAQEKLKPGQKDGVLAIGPAGENQVSYANILSGHRFFGRGGLGAVLGSKNIKAIIARGGKYKYIPAREIKMKRNRKKAVKWINRNFVTGDLYRKYGTSANVNLSNTSSILPVNNFQSSNSIEAAEITGEKMKEKFKTKYSTCKQCMILCGHKGDIGGKTLQVPEYETVGMLGSNLGIFSPEFIAEVNDLCGRMGLDTITTGVVLSWVMEAGEKGIYKTNLKFGSTRGVEETIKRIALKKKEGSELSRGTRALSEKYGGKEFAIHVKGLEFAAYDPRGAWGQGLSYAVANRGACHLSASLFALEAYFGYLKPDSARSKAYWTAFWEDLYSANNSLQMCHFVTFAYVMELPLIKMLPTFLIRFAMMNFPPVAALVIDLSTYSRFFESVTGLRLSRFAYLKAGKRIQVLERWMNTEMGISSKDDKLPERFTEESRANDKKKWVVPLEKMRKRYYAVRGYDSNGIPREKTLRKLQIIRR